MKRSAATVLLAAIVFLTGCSQVQRVPPPEVWDDMKRQGRFMAQMETEMTDVFADARMSRIPPEDTVARGHLTENTAYYTGMQGDLYVGRIPIPVTAALVKQGQMRFNINCTPCGASKRPSTP